MDLRTATIRLAAVRSDLRPHLLRLLTAKEAPSDSEEESKKK